MTIDSLDPSQKHALQHITAGNDDLSVVYGPPGTGKSQLLVNLLFELVTADKKVLFISQNTEALDVIYRMIQRIEGQMSLPENHISLTDFCLRLYTKEHRYLKYLRGQSGRLQARTMPRHVAEGIFQSDSTAPYGLSYTHLDHHENYSLEPGATGLDELLANYLSYVETDLVNEPLRDFQTIDLRVIFSALQSYESKERFTFYNDPQNELRFIGTQNSSLALSDIQNSIYELDKPLGNLHSLDITPIGDTDIKVFVESILALQPTFEQFDLYRVQNDKLNLSTLIADLVRAEELAKELVSGVDQVMGVELLEGPILVDKSQWAYLDGQSKEDYKHDLRSIVENVDKLVKAQPASATSSNHDIILDLLKLVDLPAETLLTNLPDLKRFKHDDVNKLLEETRSWNDRGRIYKLTHPFPDYYRVALPQATKQSPQYVLDHETLLSDLAELLDGTSLSLSAFAKLQKLASQKKVAINIFDSQPKEAVSKLLNGVLRIESISLVYGLKAPDLQSMNEKVIAVGKDIATYESILQSNMALASRLETEAMLELINKNIRHHAAIKQLNSLAATYGRYLHLDNNGQNLVNALPVKLPLLKSEIARIESAISSLNVSANSHEHIIMEELQRLRDMLEMSVKLKSFSEAFFALPAEKSIGEWHDARKNLLNYQNIADFDGYLRHHAAIEAIKQVMGEHNARWIDTLLEDKSLDFKAFSSRIVNNLVRKRFINTAASARPEMSESYFKKYEQELEERRRSYYLEGLSYLLEHTAGSSRVISNPNNWPQKSGSTMDKIRQATHLIRDTFPIVIATPKEVAKYLSPTEGVFDYVLFDEASQLLPGQALPSIYRAKRAVIIGDPHQMPPSLVASIGGITGGDEEEDFELNDSILDMAITLQPESQYHLKVHYRSESNKLFEPSLEAIYKEDGINPIFESQMTGSAPIDIWDNLGKNVDIETGLNANYSKIMERISIYLENDPDATFCILFTTLEEQNKFRDYLARFEDTLGSIYKLYADNKILVSTVSNCQGIEGDYSLLYLQHYDNPARMWFFNEAAGAYKRLNVAITRQRKGLCILMDDQRSAWLQVCERYINSASTEPNQMRSAKLLQSLLKNAGEVSDSEYLDKELGQNSLYFDSPLTEQLFSRLCEYYKKVNPDVKLYCEVGWHLLIPDDDSIAKNKRNIGFRIDIGVFSVSKNKFILGIEMDGAAYHSGFDKEHSDYERQRTLEMKGWDIYRIWSTNWLQDTNKEFNKLVNVIGERLVN